VDERIAPVRQCAVAHGLVAQIACDRACSGRDAPGHRVHTHDMVPGAKQLANEFAPDKSARTGNNHFHGDFTFQNAADSRNPNVWGAL
jgi:hypothetical protein